jgi:hypothetical protein
MENWIQKSDGVLYEELGEDVSNEKDANFLKNVNLLRAVEIRQITNMNPKQIDLVEKSIGLLRQLREEKEGHTLLSPRGKKQQRRGSYTSSAKSRKSESGQKPKPHKRSLSLFLPFGRGR